MSLSPGTRFGPYEVADEIGAGGMGVVYRATDTKLKRDVAIKVLPESLATDAERLTRFQREAEMLASLNHTNIAQIYGLEESDGTTALVMELVEGPTLADRIEQGAIPADEALGIAMQIAEALKGAHGQGIVHRDLKPANIKLRPDGTVKVLDFGIAKALEQDTLTSAPQSPMLTTPATQIGVILGTAAYMSPEQAKGKQIDQRADIWAFGCVLYEMLTGQPAFGGEDVPTTLARVIANDTDIESLPAAISPAVRQTIQVCLQKDVEKRLHAIGDVKLALEGAFETVPPQAGDAVTVARPIWDRPIPVAAATVLATGFVVGLAAWSLWHTPEPEPPSLNRFDYELPEDRTFRNTGRRVMTLSPDGRHFVYNSDDGFYLRTMSELGARLMPGTETEARAPTFSPDGQMVAYYDNDTSQLKRLAISGGAAVVIGPVTSNVYGVSWGLDGTILIGQPEGILRVSANGGTPEVIIPTDDGTRAYGPRMLPDGDSVLFSVGPAGDWDAAQIVVQSVSTGERTVLVEGGNDARYVPTGHLVYALGDGLFAVAFDLDTLIVSGGAVPLMQGVMRAGGTTGAANYGVSEDGTLAYVSGSGGAAAGVRSLIWVDREGGEEAITAEPGSYALARISPDQTRVALDDRNINGDIWIWDFAGETLTRLTVGEGGGSYPTWTPDGERIAYSLSNTGEHRIDWKAANNTGRPEPVGTNLTEPDSVYLNPSFFSPSGTELVYRNVSAGIGGNIGMITIGSDAEPVWLLQESYSERNAELSPDGRWMAYQSDESGTDEIYVRPFPNVDDDLVQVSNASGFMPLWSRDGRELFYLERGTGERLMSVSVEATDTDFSFGDRTALFDWPYIGTFGVAGRPYDVADDGRFLVIAPSGIIGETPPIIVVQNWLDELVRLAPLSE